MSFLLGVFKAVDMPARQSFVVEMVEGKDDLTSAIGLNSAISNSAKTLGPALADAVVAVTGEASAFFLNSLSFVAVIVSLLMMHVPPQNQSKHNQDTQMLTHIVEGVQFVQKQRTLLILMSLVAVSSFLSRPYQTLMPVFAAGNLFESAQPLVATLCNRRFLSLTCRAPEALPLGLLLTAVGVGAVLGALLVASLPARAKRGRMLTVGNLAFPLLLLVFVNSRSILISLFVLAIVGLSHVLQNAMANTLLQITVPDSLRGRVMGLYSLVSQGMTHVGGLQAGFAADWIGAPLSVGIGAGLSLLYGSFVALRYRQVRNLE
jgi:MFS family permease